MILCVYCHTLKLVHEFYLNNINKYGLTGRCTECYSKRRHPQRIQYRYDHREEINEKNRQYMTGYRVKHPEKTQQFARLFPEKIQMSREKWREKNIELARAYAATRRARKAGALIVEHVLLSVLYERDNGICQICFQPCSRENATRDHIVPLSQAGEHSYKNCRLAHWSCNSNKKKP